MRLLRILLTAAVIATPCVTASALASGLSAQGSARQVYATGLPAGADVELLDAGGSRVAVKPATDQGGVVFYGVAPGDGYRLRQLPDGPESDPVSVHTNAAAPWDPAIYDQSVVDSGYGYLTTRDGTQLAYTVRLPNSSQFPPPYPTVIEYAGYGYADPAGAHSGISPIANAMGFAVVDVNMRGTGCSGGAFNYFEPLQNLDGYDVIETIARQSWVLDHKVGMIGLSYGGISQLFTAQTRPPSLEAITPLSVVDATATTLYPGGDLNTGFAVQWAMDRQSDAQPAGPDSGQSWAYQRIQNGDQTCADNQALHGEAQDVLAKIRANTHYRPRVADPLDPVTFVHKIDVPVFVACQWQDEQTGGHCPALAEHMTGTARKWFTFTNGAHVDSLDPETFNRWFDFLNLYVAHRAPGDTATSVRGAAPILYQRALGLPPGDQVTLPPDPIQSEPTYAAALAAYDQLPPIRVLFDSGAGSNPGATNSPGDPYPGYEHTFASFPIPGTTAQRWWLDDHGKLRDHTPSAGHVDRYTSDASALPLTDYGSNTGPGGLWGNASQWDWDWQRNPDGTAVTYTSAPLSKDTSVVGAGAVHLWVRSSTPDVDLQATVSEVSADGHETFVQNGWLRASERKLSTNADNMMKRPSTLLEPVPSLRERDAKPMPADKFVKVVIPLYYSGHAYRAGTRVRITIAAPNGTQPVWSFDDPKPKGTSHVRIASSPKHPSSLILPVVPGLDVPTDQPPCPSLRSEPCR